jgi:aminoglycoside 6'-N-acetyltransferase I
LRAALWPHCPREEHLADMAMQAASDRWAQFVAYAGDGDAVGLAEACVRVDHVNGTESSPVAFLEGLYVVPQARRKGIAASLVAAVEGWARERGQRELASDAQLENEAGHAMHLALGFEETRRVVYFRKRLA